MTDQQAPSDDEQTAQPVAQAVAAQAVIPRQQRFEALFAYYDLKVLLTRENHALIGKGSASLVKTLVRFSAYPETHCLLEAGPMIEVAPGTTLLLGGEHPNDLVFNNSLNSFPMQRAALLQSGRNLVPNRTRGPIRIGGNVTLARGVTVMSGVEIGAGAVLAPGAVVTQDIEPFALAGGNPAKKLKSRFPAAQQEKLLELRWWDAELSFMFEHLETLSCPPKKLPDFKEDIPYARTDRRFVIRMQQGGPAFDFAGVEIGDKMIEVNELPRSITDYIRQLTAPDDARIMIRSDIFDKAGLS